jgi:alkylhydroperoxidase family enzyme
VASRLALRNQKRYEGVMPEDHAARIAPVEPPFAPEVADELGRWMPPNSPVEPLRLFRTLARNVPLAGAMHPLGGFFLSRRFALGKRGREVVIDRVCARCGCEYEWGVHAAVFGAVAGLDERALRATVRGTADDPAWSETDRLLVRLVDELHDTARVSDDLWRALAAQWPAETLLELLALVGWYHVIAFVANGARVEREPWAQRFP